MLEVLVNAFEGVYRNLTQAFRVSIIWYIITFLVSVPLLALDISDPAMVANMSGGTTLFLFVAMVLSVIGYAFIASAGIGFKFQMRPEKISCFGPKIGH